MYYYYMEEREREEFGFKFESYSFGNMQLEFDLIMRDVLQLDGLVGCQLQSVGGPLI